MRATLTLALAAVAAGCGGGGGGSGLGCDDAVVGETRLLEVVADDWLGEPTLRRIVEAGGVRYQMLRWGPGMDNDDTLFFRPDGVLHRKGCGGELG